MNHEQLRPINERSIMLAERQGYPRPKFMCSRTIVEALDESKQVFRHRCVNCGAEQVNSLMGLESRECPAWK